MKPTTIKLGTIVCLVFALSISARAQSPGGVSTNLYLWTKADAGVTTPSGSNVSQWNNQAATSMTTQPSKTASSHVTLNTNAFNYNPTLVYDGTSSEVLAGTFTTAPTNKALLFAVVKKDNTTDNDNANPYALGSAGAAGINYQSSIHGYAVDYPGGPCARTGDLRNIPGIARAFYTDATTITGATGAFNGTSNAVDCSTTALATPNGTFQIGGRTFGGQNTRVFAGQIAEVIQYNSSTVLTTTQINQVESYLAIKYGTTLSHNYLNSSGSTIYDVSSNGANVIGIGSDNASGLIQKQSHQTDDATRIYLSTLQTSNSANSGSFSGDGYVIMGNNGGTLTNTGSTEYPSTVTGRINREWKVTNTGFTGSFSMDITMTSLAATSNLALLVDGDGDFSSGAKRFTALDGLTFSYTGGILTIGGITNAMLPANATNYITIANWTATPGGVSNNLYLWTKADVGVTTSGSNVSQWTNQASTSMATQPMKAASSHVVLNNNNFNYNPSLVYDGTSGETIKGAFTSASSNPAMMFAVVNKSSSANIDLSNPYSLDTAGAAAIAYQSATNSFAVDYSGGACAPTANVLNTPGIARVDYNSASTSSGATSAFNGLVTAVSCGSNTLQPTTGRFEIGGRTFGGPSNPAPQPTRVFNGLIAEVVHFNTNTLPNGTADINKVETYLAVKYGITLDHSGSGTLGGNYTASDGTTIWNASTNSSYDNNIIGIGRDDYSALYQKQSHQADDSTRIYISMLASSNAANSGTFSSNGQFVMMGNNAGSLAIGSTEYPAGISARVYREWQVTNTAFTGTFSVDIKPVLTCTPDTNRFRLLVDADGNFSSGATTYSSADGLTFVNTGGVISIQGITTTMIPANSTRYITLATAPLTGGTPASAQTICLNNTPSDLTLSGSLGSVAKWQYSIDSFATDVHDIASSNSVTLTAAQMGALTANRYYRAVVQDGFCATANSTAVLMTITNTSTWLGTTSSDWNTASNWSCNYVPLITTDVLIPSTSNKPVLSTGATGTAHNITINSGGTLTITGKTLQVSGTVSNSGSFDATGGTIELKGTSSQTLAGSWFVSNTIENLIISNTASNVSSSNGDMLKIVNTLSFGNVNSATLTTGDNITLLSDCGTAITARVADITNNGTNSGNSITGKVVVERCIPSHRAWRFLTAPITGNQTISAAWQEGAVDETLGQRVNPNPGYGVQITGGPTRNATGVGNTGGNGFDAGPNSSSMLYMENGLWTTPANTSSTPITDKPDYMLFVRGNRSTNLQQATYAASSQTILRPKGGLNQNNIATAFSGSAGIKPVGNPYASTINYKTVTRSSNVSSYYYTWDPVMTGGFGVGAFITLVPNGGGGYDPVPDPSVATSNNTVIHTIDTDGSIQSGSAFMVYHDGGTDSLVIKETDKKSSSNLRSFMRPMQPVSTEKIRTNIYSVDADAPTLLDGVMSQFSTGFSDDVDMEDVRKMRNISEYIGIMRNSKQLSVEKMAPLNENDTIYLSMTNMKVKNYRFEFMPTGINRPDLQAYLEDVYLNSKTAVSLTDATTIPITIDNTTGSKAADRFRVVFNRTAVVLPVTFISVDAQKQASSNDISVSWSIATQTNVQKYIVERSADGNTFTQVATVAINNTNTTTAAATYNWVDATPLEGTNYYRIVSVETSNGKGYSKVVNVIANSKVQSVKLINNHNGVISYEFTNMPKGKYSVQLLNAELQLIAKDAINYSGGSSTQQVTIHQHLPSGIYIVNMQKPDGTMYNAKIKE